MAQVEGKAKVTVDGEQAGQQLNKLENEATELKKVLVDLKKQSILDNTKIKDTESKLRAVNKEIKSVKAQQVSYNKVLKNLSGASLKELNSAYRKLKAETAVLNRETDKFKKNAGNLKLIQSEIRNVKKEMSGAGVASKGFSINLKDLASQAVGFAGITTVIAVATNGLRKFKESSEELINIQQDLKSSFELTNRELRIHSSELRAISTTYKDDYEKTTNAATVAALKFNEPLENIIDNIEEGFAKGSNKTGEFNDIIIETSARMADAGISADEYFSIINQSVTSGAYSDKGLQAIAEGAQRLREWTQATEDALAPLDESIKKQIEQEVAAGNSFKAVQLVSEALKDASLTANQAQTIIADVFGGDGEEAGRAYLEMISEMDVTLANVTVTATENEQATLQLEKSWNYFVSGVSKSDGIFSKVWAKFKELLAGAISSLTFLIDLFDGGDKAVDKVGKAIEKLKKQQQEQNKVTEEASEKQKELTEEQKKYIKERQKVNKQLEDQIKSLNIQLIEDARQKAIEEANLWAEKEKKKVENSKGSAKLKAQAVEAIEANHIKKIQTIDDDYTNKIVEKYENVGRFLEQQNTKLETDRQAIIDRELEAIAAKYDEQIAMAEEQLSKETDLQEEFEEQIFELKKLKDEELKAYKENAELEHSERIKAIREEFGLVTDEEKMEEELDLLKTFYDEKLLTDEEYEQARANIIKRYQRDELSDWNKLWDEKFKKIRKTIAKEEAITQAFGDFFSATKEAELAEAGENEEKKKEIMKSYADKEFIIKAAQITASTAQAAMVAYAQLGPIAGPIVAALITATGFIKLGQANKERQRVKGLEGGGEFGVTRQQDGKKFKARFGGSQRGFIDRPTILVGENNKKEFVVANKTLQVPAFSRAVSAMDAYQHGQSIKHFNYDGVMKAIGTVKGLEEGGTFGTSGTETTSTNASDESMQVVNLLYALIQKFDNFTEAITAWQTELEVFIEIQKIREAETELSTLEASVKLG